MRLECRFCSKLQNEREASPFSAQFNRQVVLDFYDGVLSSLLSCGECGRAYVAKIVDWDRKFDQRVFALAEVPAELIEETITIYGKSGETPRWPIWVPTARSLADRSLHEKLKARIFGAMGNYISLVVSDRFITTITASRPLNHVQWAFDIESSNESGLPKPVRDWFEFVNS